MMSSDFPKPSSACLDFMRKCDVPDFDAFMEKMTRFGEYLYETNKSFNLTAIKPEFFWSKHVADSLSLALAFKELSSGVKMRICDLGCGAGLPSIVLAAAFPEILMTSVDSTRKKIDFVSSSAERIGLKNLRAVHARGNELGGKDGFRGRFNAVCARAVSDADTLMKESFSLLSHSGRLIIYRTPSQYSEELPLLQKNLKITFSASGEFLLPDDAGTRLFVFIGKANSGSKN